MAATDLERLVVQLSADIKKYENALNRASGITNQRARQIETRFAKMSKNINSGAANAAVAAGKAFALIGGAQGFKTLSDAATRIDNALRVAGLSGAELEKTYQLLFAAATKNAVPVETLVQLYSRLSLVQGELGVTQDQVRVFTEKISLALRAGGTSAQEAAGALTQLGQALGNGVVRAEEFQSLFEGAPTILQAAAAGIEQAEGSVGKLRKIMLEGNLSSKALFDGFQAGSVILEKRVAGSVLTIEDRLGNLNSALVNAAREFNTSSKAGETFGSAIDQVSAFVNGIDFNGLISQIQAVAAAMNSGIATVNSFAEAYSRLSGYNGIGRDIVNMLPGDGAKKSFLGGGLTVTSTAGITDRINQAFEGEIQKAGELTSEAVKNSVLGGGPATTPKGGRVPAASTVNPISIADPQYAVPATAGKAKGGGSKSGAKSADDFAREIEQIKERTIALQAETEAQGAVNPLVNDYGFAVEKASAQQDLLNAAKEAGLIKDAKMTSATPELAKQIDTLATSYANAHVAAERLDESQDKIRQSAEEMREFQKDLTRGIVDGFIEGKKAADIFADALSKIGTKLLDMTFDSLFAAPTSGGKSSGGLGSILGSLFGFSSGGYTGNGGKYDPAGVVHKGEYVMDAASTKRIGVGNLQAMQAGRMPTLPSIPRKSGGDVSVSVPIQIDATGADAAGLARVERQIATLKASLPATIVKTVKDANGRRTL